ncbi:PQQ-binding-like beta-propeller repeat protein [Halorussus salilacus]|uniref:outer membrane protein assembly factor BamB family protein n=1 Tax=Halorussus salilacus TaxID=2953750 RepID=UPI00209FB635|nr:PQQ-binding-like beta-propeller repeat protein [Halorussus salilacus]USZ67436.1 PQQ-binding-like beta-propeller repeat protein [Halorussus salilacus]
MPSDTSSPISLSRRELLAATATASAVAAAGCAGTESVPDDQRWSQFGFDTANTAHNPDAEGPAEEPTVAWVRVGGSYYRNSTQPLVGDAVYANAWHDGVFALDPADGSVRWHDGDADNTQLTPALAEGTLAFPTRDGFRGVAADGGLRAFGRAVGYGRWRTDLDYPQSPPSVADGLLVAGIGANHSADGGRVAAVDAADGTVRWEFPVETSVWGAPAVADGVVYAAARDDDQRDAETQGTVHAIDLADGTEVWSRPLGESPRFNPVGAPVVGDGLVYVPTGTGPLVALGAESGEEVWRADPPEGVQASPALAGGVLYAGCLDGTLRALDAATGEVEWTGEAQTYYGGPTVGERGVYAVGSGGEVVSWTRDGRERWRVAIDPPVSGSPVPAEGRLFVGTGDGLLYALE